MGLTTIVTSFDCQLFKKIRPPFITLPQNSYLNQQII